MKQQFETSRNEAIYGLGQHHDRLLNIKGYDLDLFQHNTEVYVPFFVSSQGYGLLWHNYSHTKFGNPDAIQSISPKILYDEDGKQGGLTLTTYSDNLFKKGGSWLPTSLVGAQLNIPLFDGYYLKCWQRCTH